MGHRSRMSKMSLAIELLFVAGLVGASSSALACIETGDLLLDFSPRAKVATDLARLKHQEDLGRYYRISDTRFLQRIFARSHRSAPALRNIATG